MKQKIMAEIHEQTMDVLCDADKKQHGGTDSPKDKKTEMEPDKTVISDAYRLYDKRNTDGTLLSSITGDYLDDLWLILENWIPSPGQSLAYELDLLKKQYEIILWKIMEYFNQEESERLVRMLDSHIIALIQKLEIMEFPNLHLFLEEFGSRTVDADIKTALFRLLTGRSISPQKLLYKMQESPVCTQKDAPLGQDGLLYCRNSSNTVKIDKIYQQNLRDAEQAALKEDCVHTVKKAGAFSHVFKTNYTARDIERTEHFIQYINQGGSLLSGSPFTALNEELIGFLMAETMIKAQIFMEYSVSGSGMEKSLLPAMDKYLFHTLADGYHRCQLLEHNIKDRGLDEKAVWQTYHIIMNLFCKHKNPQKTLSKGLIYALEQFIAKKKAPEYKVMRRYGEHSGFFRNTPPEKDSQKELAYGVHVIEKEWRNFLTAIGQKENQHLQLVMPHAPWGIIMETQEPEQRPHFIHPVFFLIAGAVAVAAVILIKIL